MININTKDNIIYSEIIEVDNEKFEIFIDNEKFEKLMVCMGELNSSGNPNSLATLDSIAKIFFDPDYNTIRGKVKGLQFTNLMVEIIKNLNDFIQKKLLQK